MKFKRIVYLSYYFEPDLSAGSFRNTPLVKLLSEKLKNKNVNIDLYTSFPIRYKSFQLETNSFEKFDNLRIHRIKTNNSFKGLFNQFYSFYLFAFNVLRLNYNKKCNLVVASSSRLFTAFLGYILSVKFNSKLYVDIRDIFPDAIKDFFKKNFFKKIILTCTLFIEYLIFNRANHVNLISPGFKKYFSKYKKPNFSFFTNGIDLDIFNKNIKPNKIKKNKVVTVVYAGNIGEGQGLENIIPTAAKKLGSNYRFLIIGDGNKKFKLIDQIKKLKVDNVYIKKPVKREKLFQIYSNANFLFLHLNYHNCLKKVLPSKIFELAMFNKPILAGVSGFAKEFIKEEVRDCFIFHPCDSNSLILNLKKYKNKKILKRKNFLKKYDRKKINDAMSDSIIKYI